MTTRPPDVPPTPDANPKMTDYFRRMASWAVKELDNRIDRRTAEQQILLQAPDGSVWSVTVSNVGALVITSVPIGGGL